MNRKTYILFSLLLAFSFLFVSCQTAAETEPIAEPSDAETTTDTESQQPVTVTWWHISTADADRALFQAIADEYMTLHPNVTIEITVLENEAFKTKLTTVMQSGNPPDIFQSWGGGVMNEYAEAGLLTDITSALDADDGAWRATFSPGALGVYAYKGSNYGVPRDMGMVGFWYNKDLFTQAGITNTPTTWSEFIDTIEKLKAAGITPIALGAGDKWPAAFWWEYFAVRIGGQAAFDAAQNRTGSFADAAFVEAGEKIQELAALEPFQNGYLGATQGDAATALGNGNVAMELMGQWAPSTYAANSADGKGIGDKLGWFPFPAVEGGDGGATDALGGGNGWAIGKNASPEAIDFVKFLSSVDSETRQAQQGLALPVVVGSETGVTDPMLVLVQKGTAAAEYFQLYYDQYLPPAMGSVVNDISQGLFAGSLTPEQAAQMLENSAKEQLK